jgi:oxysterol-binding protein-related protein 3/6/7
VETSVRRSILTKTVHKTKSSENLDEETAKKDEDSPGPSDDRLPESLFGVLSGLGTLEKQHKQLMSSFNALLHLDTVTSPTRAMSPTGDWIGIRYPSRAGTIRRALSTATASDDSIQWFDADDGPEEYVIEEPDGELEAEIVEPQALASDQESDSGLDEKRYGTPDSSETVEKKVPVRRRTHLPAPVMGDEMSLLNILRKNVGKAGLIYC